MSRKNSSVLFDVLTTSGEYLGTVKAKYYWMYETSERVAARKAYLAFRKQYDPIREDLVLHPREEKEGPGWPQAFLKEPFIRQESNNPPLNPFGPMGHPRR